MTRRWPAARRRPYGFSLIEVVVVLVILGIIFRIALPRLNLGRYRSDAGAQQVQSAVQMAQRMAITRQHDVILSVDVARRTLRIGDDTSSNGSIEAAENKLWRAIGDGNQFAIPPKGLTTPNVTAPVVGAQLKLVTNLPSIVFHRDGSASTDAEIYLTSQYRSRTDYRLVTVSRATGRAELYRLSGTGATATWLASAP